MPLGFSDGRTDDTLVPSTSEVRQINPVAAELLSGLSFIYVGNSTESYSVNLEIRPSSKTVNIFVFKASLGEVLWEIKGWENPIRIPIVQNLFSSSSTHLESTMTSAVHTSSMPSLPSPPPSNNPSENIVSSIFKYRAILKPMIQPMVSIILSVYHYYILKYCKDQII